MVIDVKEIRVAYVTGKLPKTIMQMMTDVDASMYNDDGGGQYELEALRDRFYEDDEEWRVLDELMVEGYDYVEYS